MLGRVEVLEKALAILDVIAAAGECPLPHVAAELGLPFSTVHRLVQSLCASGHVFQVGRGRYRVGAVILHLASTTSFPALLSSVARPVVAALAERYQLCAHLGTLDADMVTYLIKEAPVGDTVFSSEGLQLEGYCTAIGKALLAHQPKARLREYLHAGSFVALTKTTIVEIFELEAEFESVRRKGWAFDNEESLEGLRCVAVPVFDGRGNIMAALSISGSASKLPDADIASVAATIRQSATRLTHLLFPVRASR